MDFSYYEDTPYKNTQYYYEALELVGENQLDMLYMRIFNTHLKNGFIQTPLICGIGIRFLKWSLRSLEKLIIVLRAVFFLARIYILLHSIAFWMSLPWYRWLSSKLDVN